MRLDPSFKQYEDLTGLDVLAISGLDGEALAESFLASGTRDESAGWVAGLDASLLQDAQAQATQQVEAYIAEHLTDPTVGDVIGGRRTIVQDHPMLPSDLANRVVFEGATYDRLPDPLRLHLSLGLASDALDDPIDPVRLPWSTVNNRKLTLSFRPATAADEQALAALLPDGEITDVSQLPDDIPGYLIAVIPELKLDGAVIRAATSLAAGFGSFGYEPEVDTFFGIPRGIRPGGVAMNIYVADYSATHAVDAAARQQLNLQLGALSSTLEHAVPEQLFDTDPDTPPDAVSAVKAISKASAAGQRIYQITEDNLNQALPNLHLAQATEEEIVRAVRAGKLVITHTDPIAVPGWTGAGYVILDPETGVGAWKIGGGGNGSYQELSETAVIISAAALGYTDGRVGHY